MNEVNVGVQVPQTSENATGSSTSNTSQNRIQVQTAGEGGITIPTSTTKPLISPREDAGLALFAIIFILVAIVLLVLVFRDKILKMLKR